MKPKKKPPQFGARKKAFDDVLDAYRKAKDTGIGAVVIGDGGKSVRIPTRPSLTDFRCDVDKVIRKCVTNRVDFIRFRLAYVEFDSDNLIDMEIYADKVVGTGRHNLEQGLGAEFIKRGIYPMHGKRGYFHVVRQPRGDV